MPVVIEGSKGVTGDAGNFKTITVGMVGDRRGVVMQLDAAAMSATAKVGYHILSDASGNLLIPPSADAIPIDLATSGAGGVATGSKVTVSSYVGLYHIYNKTTGDQKLLAVDAALKKLPEVCDPALLPQGYGFSALLSVVPTDSTGKMVQHLLSERHIACGGILAITSDRPAENGRTITQHEVGSKICLNSKSMSLRVEITAAVATMYDLFVGALPGDTINECSQNGYIPSAGPVGGFSGRIPIGESTSLYLNSANSAHTTMHVSVYLTGFDF